MTAPADPANPVVDGSGVRFYVVIAPEIERLTHRVNVALSEKRENVRLKARQIRHGSKNLKDIVDGTVRQTIAGPDRSRHQPMMA
jgi:hypothetical protein